MVPYLEFHTCVAGPYQLSISGHSAGISCREVELGSLHHWPHQPDHATELLVTHCGAKTMQKDQPELHQSPANQWPTCGRSRRIPFFTWQIRCAVQHNNVACSVSMFKRDVHDLERIVIITIQPAASCAICMQDQSWLLRRLRNRDRHNPLCVHGCRSSADSISSPLKPLCSGAKT